MIWSTPYFTENSASRLPNSAPAIGAATTPAYGVRKNDAAMTPANAPTSRSPSIAMLTTPTCSETTPDRAPKISGVEIATVDTSVEVSVTAPLEPDPAKTRNPRTVAAPAAPIIVVSRARVFVRRWSVE